MELVPFDVQAYIMGHFGLPLGSFTVHPNHLKDFIMLFRDFDVLQQILDAPLPSSLVHLVFNRWGKECRLISGCVALHKRFLALPVPSLWLHRLSPRLL
jgi:hypothetical protein